MPDRAVTISVSMLAVGQGIAVFNTMMPPITEIRKRTPDTDPEFAADVRVAEIVGSVITLGIGLIMSSLSQSSLPALVAIMVAAGLTITYECVLRSWRPMEGK